MAKYVLERLKKQMKKKKNNIIPVICPQYLCEYVLDLKNHPKGSDCGFCNLENKECHPEGEKYFFNKSKEIIDKISSKYAAVAIVGDPTIQFWTINEIAKYAKQKGLLTIALTDVYLETLEYVWRFTKEYSNFDIIEILYEDVIKDYGTMLINIKKYNKAIVLPHKESYKSDEVNVNQFKNYVARKVDIEVLRNGDLEDNIKIAYVRDVNIEDSEILKENYDIGLICKKLEY